MRLYTNENGQWFGTVRDAQRTKALTGLEWEEVNVPTAKADLLDFLNANAVGAEVDSGSTGTHKQPEPTPPTSTGITCSTYKPASDLNAYDVRDVVTACDRKHLGQALGSIISRLHDELEVTS